MEQNQSNMKLMNDVGNQQQPNSGKPAKGKVTFKAIIAIILSIFTLLFAGFMLLPLGNISASLIQALLIVFFYGIVLTLVVFVYARYSIFGIKRKATANSGAPSTSVSPVIAGFWLGICLACVILLVLVQFLSIDSIGFITSDFHVAVIILLVPSIFIALWLYLIIKHWNVFKIRPGRVLLGFLSCLLLGLTLLAIPLSYDYYLRRQDLNKYMEYRAQVEQRLQSDIHPKFMDFALWQSWDECDEVINSIVNSSVLEEGSRDDREHNRISEDSIIYRYKIVKTVWKNMTIKVSLFGDKDKVFGIFVKNDAGFSDLGEEACNMLSEEYGKPERGFDLEEELEQNGVSEEDMPGYVDYDDVWRFKNCNICFEKNYGELLYIDSNYNLSAIELRSIF